MTGQKNSKNNGTNKMREIKIVKITLNIGAGKNEDLLNKGLKLLKKLSPLTPVKTTTNKRIPSFNLRPGLEIGCKVTMRGEKAKELLKRLLETVDNEIKERWVVDGHFSFGIKEYIEIPDVEYQREIGIIGFNVTVVFRRKGLKEMLCQ